MPKRIQLRRTKGWRKPDGAIVVSRPTKWGNPFPVIPGVVTREQSVAWHREWLLSDLVPDGAIEAYQLSDDEVVDLEMRAWELRHDADELEGHDLFCWCPVDQPCHGDNLLELANE